MSSVPLERAGSLQNGIKAALQSHLEEESNRLMRSASCKDALGTFDFKSAAEDFAKNGE